MATKRSRNGWPVMPDSNGWQTGNPSSILAQYGTPGQGMMASYGGFPVGYSPTAPTTPRPTAGGFPVAGAAGPTGDPAPTGNGYDAAPSPIMDDPSTMARMPGTPGIGAPGKNAMQRQQEEAEQPAGVRGLSPQRRSFWATGLIDARATSSPRNRLTNWEDTFGTGASHMGSRGTTWQERQQSNQQKIADVKKQRGLDDWQPY